MPPHTNGRIWNPPLRNNVGDKITPLVKGERAAEGGEGILAKPYPSTAKAVPLPLGKGGYSSSSLSFTISSI